jgi:2-dehydropantoate 2-reductase
VIVRTVKHMEKEKGNIRVAVVGAGAIGGIVAAFLARAGWDMEVVCKHQEMVDRAQSDGFHIFGVQGEHRIPLRGVKGTHDLSGPKEVVFLATKANDATEAARDLLPFLKENAVVVSLQNGICEEALAEILGRNRVIGCVVGWGASMHGPGELEMTSGGEFVIGSMDSQSEGRLPLIKLMLDEIAPTRISENIMGELYAKLIINACINSLGVIAGAKLGELLAMKRARQIFIAIMQEAVAVAEAVGIKVEPGGGGKLDYYRFLEEGNLFSSIKRHLLIRIIGFKYRWIKSSSLQSIERGRKTEIDYLNGYFCERGRQHGVPTPVNDAVLRMVKEIEAGQRGMTPENLKDPGFENL